MKEEKLQTLCDEYDRICRRIAILERELEELKQQSRDLHLQMEKEL